MRLCVCACVGGRGRVSLGARACVRVLLVADAFVFFRARWCDLCTGARAWLRVYVLVCFLRSDLRGVRFVRLLARMFV